jgi:hypothetical protein
VRVFSPPPSLFLLEPELMEIFPSQSILKWGNRRANVYWEAHLKAGHVPPEQYALLSDFVDLSGL